MKSFKKTILAVFAAMLLAGGAFADTGLQSGLDYDQTANPGMSGEFDYSSPQNMWLNDVDTGSN